MDEGNGSPIGEMIRRVARTVRDDHADGARCEDCTDEGCRWLKQWGPTITRMGAALDD